MNQDLLESSTTPESANPDRSPVTPGRALIVIAVGGAFQALARHPEVAGGDMLFYLDVGIELARLPKHPGLVTVELAAGQTPSTLLQDDTSGPLGIFFAHRPAVLLSTGLAQLRALGHRAAHQLLADQAFGRPVATEIIDPLLVRHNGRLDEVEISVWTSTAGGTGGPGGPAGPAVARALADIFLAQTPAVVHFQLVRAGSMSFVGLGAASTTTPPPPSPRGPVAHHRQAAARPRDALAGAVRVARGRPAQGAALRPGHATGPGAAVAS